jgi:hypothetical protein
MRLAKVSIKKGEGGRAIGWSDPPERGKALLGGDLSKIAAPEHVWREGPEPAVHLPCGHCTEASEIVFFTAFPRTAPLKPMPVMRRAMVQLNSLTFTAQLPHSQLGLNQ